MLIQEDVPLAPLTTLGIGGPARYFVEARDESSALAALSYASQRQLPVFVLGGGSNVLVADAGFPGLVLHITIRGIQECGAAPDGSAVFTVGAGEDWDNFVRLAVERGLGGVECLSGIPGTVGGTPVQNVGAYGQEVSETIRKVRVYDRQTQQIRELANAECGFSYRRSIFNTSERERYLVLAVTYALRPDVPPTTRYADVQKYFEGKVVSPSLAQVREAVRSIRASKAMLLTPGEPDSRSAGSFFKNPIVSEVQYAEVCARAGVAVPRYAMRNGSGVKLPAAWLIERAGFSKGYGHGAAGLSRKHTLALVNRGGASARDVLRLMREIQQGVGQRFGLGLEPEPQFVGFAAAEA